VQGRGIQAARMRRVDSSSKDLHYRENPKSLIKVCLTQEKPEEPHKSVGTTVQRDPASSF
jgi:hypothetical protein